MKIDLRSCIRVEEDMLCTVSGSIGCFLDKCARSTSDEHKISGKVRSVWGQRTACICLSRGVVARSPDWQGHVAKGRLASCPSELARSVGRLRADCVRPINQKRGVLPVVERGHGGHLLSIGRTAGEKDTLVMLFVSLEVRKRVDYGTPRHGSNLESADMGDLLETA